ncbi:MAG: hypothetical protein A3I05_07825 [Deltaproteobacteria bacterium RIFCSPLOWO2_02_FULL_44_10]|nr:MAG: hypothetical protein A3C46_03610 [Deltaproteobacteria bacterium RIFCSPHIGHO2_02_FULL_44_16]OGQ47634.1 MAG: hypothetical protein A3I05_07825 [Deltaproteobacteria bacterium RIFCSPLOWO2_02_FULL_44_10]
MKKTLCNILLMLFLFGCTDDATQSIPPTQQNQNNPVAQANTKNTKLDCQALLSIDEYVNDCNRAVLDHKYKYYVGEYEISQQVGCDLVQLYQGHDGQEKEQGMYSFSLHSYNDGDGIDFDTVVEKIIKGNELIGGLKNELKGSAGIGNKSALIINWREPPHGDYIIVENKKGDGFIRFTFSACGKLSEKLENMKKPAQRIYDRLELLQPVYPRE